MTTKKTFGRRLSKREVEIHQIEGHEAHFGVIDWDDVWGTTTIERHRQRARDVLEREGIDVQRLLDDSPYGSHLRDYVLNSLGREPDSLAGLAARIFELCSDIFAYQSTEGGSIKIPNLAYLLGQLVILSKAYAIESGAQSARASKRRNDVTKADLVAYREKYKEDGRIAGRKNPARGWQKAACLKFGISQKTLTERMKE